MKINGKKKDELEEVKKKAEKDKENLEKWKRQEKILKERLKKIEELNEHKAKDKKNNILRKKTKMTK